LLKGEILIGKDAQYISEPLKEGALYESFYQPGGGGLGDPLDRDPAMVERDVNLNLVSRRAAERVYGAVGRTNRNAEWKADPVRSDEVRAGTRRARLARAVPVKEWWREERQRVLSGKIKGATAAMYADCLVRSPGWAQSYREFWALPDDFTSPASEDERQDKNKKAE